MTDLKPILVLAAFEGWNDAGNAASDAVALVATAWDARTVATLDPEDYYDFQVNRPMVTRGDAGAELAWPSTRVSVATSPVTGRRVLLVQGIEPSMRWRQYTDALLDVVAQWSGEAEGVPTVVGVGALLADVPHTRPIPVQSTSDDPALQESLGLDASEYVGPVGI
ncbi:PAC2 family protein, partial [Cutibacterium acnes]